MPRSSIVIGGLAGGGEAALPGALHSSQSRVVPEIPQEPRKAVSSNKKYKPRGQLISALFTGRSSDNLELPGKDLPGEATSASSSKDRSDEVWVASESAHGYNLNEIVAEAKAGLPLGSIMLQDRGVMLTASGQALFVRRLHRNELSQCNKAEAAGQDEDIDCDFAPSSDEELQDAAAPGMVHNRRSALFTQGGMVNVGEEPRIRKDEDSASSLGSCSDGELQDQRVLAAQSFKQCDNSARLPGATNDAARSSADESAKLCKTKTRRRSAMDSAEVNATTHTRRRSAMDVVQDPASRPTENKDSMDSELSEAESLKLCKTRPRRRSAMDSVQDPASRPTENKDSMDSELSEVANSAPLAQAGMFVRSTGGPMSARSSSGNLGAHSRRSITLLAPSLTQSQEQPRQSLTPRLSLIGWLSPSRLLSTLRTSQVEQQ